MISAALCMNLSAHSILRQIKPYSNRQYHAKLQQMDVHLSQETTNLDCTISVDVVHHKYFWFGSWHVHILEEAPAYKLTSGPAVYNEICLRLMMLPP